MPGPNEPNTSKLEELRNVVKGFQQGRDAQDISKLSGEARKLALEKKAALETEKKLIEESNKILQHQEATEKSIQRISKERKKLLEQENALYDKRMNTTSRKEKRNIEEQIQRMKEQRTQAEKEFKKELGRKKGLQREADRMSARAQEGLRRQQDTLSRIEKLEGAREIRNKNITRLMGDQSKLGGTLGGAIAGYKGETPGGGAGLKGAMKGGLAGLGASMTDSGVGKILTDIATGNWVGAVLGAAREGVSMTAEVDDKLAKLAANYIKATGQIKGTNEEAIGDLTHFVNKFKDAYGDSIDELKRFGIAHDDAYKAIARFSKSVQPITNMSKALSQLAKDSYQYATMLDSTQETVSTDMEAAFTQFGHTADQIGNDLQSVYGILDAANNTTIEGFDRAIVRMKEYSSIVFESARRANLWSFSYADVSSLLGEISKKTAAAGLAEDKRQKIAKGIIGIGQGEVPEFIDLMAGKGFMEGLLRDVEGKTGQDLQKALTKLGYKGNEENIAEAIESARAGGGMELTGAHLLKIIGDERAMQARFQTEADTLRSVGKSPKDLMGRMATMKELAPGVTDPGVLQTIQRMLVDGQVEGAVKAAKEAQQAAAGAKPKTAAEAISFASEGMISSTERLIESEKELAKVTVFAGKGMWVLAKAMGSKEAEKEMAKRELAERADIQALPPEVRAMVERTGIDPFDKSGGMSIYDIANIKDKGARFHQLRKKDRFGDMAEAELMLGAVQRDVDVQNILGGQESVADKKAKLEGLGFSEKDAIRRIAMSTGREEGDVAAEARKAAETEQANFEERQRVRKEQGLNVFGVQNRPMGIDPSSAVLDFTSEEAGTITFTTKVRNADKATAGGMVKAAQNTTGSQE